MLPPSEFRMYLYKVKFLKTSFKNFHEDDKSRLLFNFPWNFSRIELLLPCQGSYQYYALGAGKCKKLQFLLFQNLQLSFRIKFKNLFTKPLFLKLISILLSSIFTKLLDAFNNVYCTVLIFFDLNYFLVWTVNLLF